MSLIHPVPGHLFKASLTEAHAAASQTHAKDQKATIKVRELLRVEVLGDAIKSKTEKVVKETVNFNELPPFQRELVEALIDVDEVRRALHSVGWAGSKALDLSHEYRKRMRGTMEVDKFTSLRKQYEKRVESIVHGVRKDIEIINQAEKQLKKIPSIKKMKTVLIAGYPNVGKSSILNAISDSKVDVQPYPFTTKSILVGYMKAGYRRFQIIDTPGVLDREAQNRVERQAIAAIRHLSDHILYIFDPSETCGYTLEQQNIFYEKLKREMHADVMAVYSKADLKQATKTKTEVSALPKGISVSANEPASIDALKKRIVEWFPTGETTDS